jgi:hypothetical protein
MSRAFGIFAVGFVGAFAIKKASDELSRFLSGRVVIANRKTTRLAVRIAISSSVVAAGFYIPGAGFVPTAASFAGLVGLFDGLAKYWWYVAVNRTIGYEAVLAITTTFGIAYIAKNADVRHQDM